MIRELKTFQHECDSCKTTKVVVAQHDWERPEGWITVHIEPHWEWHGGTFHYCGECVVESKKHSPDEDSHFGRIKRAILGDKKKKK
jgi:hypothetical protein